MEYAELLDGRRQLVAASRHWKRAAEISKMASQGLKLTGTSAAEQRREAAATSGAA
jgi:hypothetical protein